MKVKVYHSECDYNFEVKELIEGLYEKYGDRLIDWKITYNEGYVIFYVLKDDNCTPDEVDNKKPIKI